MKTQHTQGPWHCLDDNSLLNYYIMNEDHKIVAEIKIPTEEIPWSASITRANARLIAAAPELLEALLACECELSQNHGLAWSNRNAFLDAVNTARAAIKKARGES